MKAHRAVLAAVTIKCFLLWETDSLKTWLDCRQTLLPLDVCVVLKTLQRASNFQPAYCWCGQWKIELNLVACVRYWPYLCDWPDPHTGTLMLSMPVVYAHPHGEKKQLSKLEAQIWSEQRSKGESLLFSMLVVKQTAQLQCYFWRLKWIAITYMISHKPSYRYRILCFTSSIACRRPTNYTCITCKGTHTQSIILSIRHFTQFP